MSLIKFSTLKHTEERIGIISTFIYQAGDDVRRKDIHFNLHIKATAEQEHCKGQSLQGPQQSL